MQADFRQRVLEIYSEVDQAVADAGPVCLASGRCCHFREFDHVLYLSALEAEILLEVPSAGGRPLSADRCPYQEKNLCTARDRRPLACRVYFCDPRYQETAQQISEYYLSKLKALAREYGLEWQYAPLHSYIEGQAGEAPCAQQ
jgi:Fe-S-cluster containining protein